MLILLLLLLVGSDVVKGVKRRSEEIDELERRQAGQWCCITTSSRRSACGRHEYHRLESSLSEVMSLSLRYNGDASLVQEQEATRGTTPACPELSQARNIDQNPVLATGRRLEHAAAVAEGPERIQRTPERELLDSERGRETMYRTRLRLLISTPAEHRRTGSGSLM